MDELSCHYCEKPAVVVCDFVIGKVQYAEGCFWATCDRPICNDHRLKVGHICDRSRRTTNNLSDTIDHCRVHEEGKADG